MRSVVAIMFGVAIVGAIADRAVATNEDAASSEERRWYVSGIVGASFMTLSSGGENTVASVPNTGAATGGAFTGGGAIGIAMPVEGGRWRAEVEGRQRGKLAGQTDFIGDPFFYDVQAEDGWSVTANLWRDVSITNHVDLYAGGGIGGGGYRLSVADQDQIFSTGYDRIGEFAWQAGGGVVWNPNRRLSIDLGYRFFAVGTGSTPLTDPFSSGPAGVYTSALSASEVLLTFRMYEPFAALRARR